MGSYVLKYPLGIGRGESPITWTSGEGERCSTTREAAKAGWPCASPGGHASALEAFFANLIVNSTLVLIAKHLESFGNLPEISHHEVLQGK